MVRPGRVVAGEILCDGEFETPPGPLASTELLRRHMSFAGFRCWYASHLHEVLTCVDALDDPLGAIHGERFGVQHRTIFRIDELRELGGVTKHLRLDLPIWPLEHKIHTHGHTL